MRYERKILTCDPKGKRLRGRSGSRLENNTITGLGCPAFRIHCVITPVRVRQVCVCVCTCHSSDIERWKPKRLQIFMPVLYAGRCFAFQMASNHPLVGHFIVKDGLNATVHSVNVI
jgi:hypothetical protein